MASNAHVEILRKGVEVWNEWRRNNPEVRPDLSGIDLTWAQLPEIDLRGADLHESCLAAGNFSGADFSAHVITRNDEDEWVDDSDRPGPWVVSPELVARVDNVEPYGPTAVQ